MSTVLDRARKVFRPWTLLFLKYGWVSEAGQQSLDLRIRGES